MAVQKKTKAARKTPLGKRVLKLRKKLLENGYKVSGTNYSAGSVTLKALKGVSAKTTKDNVKAAAQVAKNCGFTVTMNQNGLKLNEPELLADNQTVNPAPAAKTTPKKVAAKAAKKSAKPAEATTGAEATPTTGTKKAAKKAPAKKAAKKKTAAKPTKPADVGAQTDALGLTPVVSNALQVLVGGVDSDALTGILVPIVKAMPAKARKNLVVTLAEAVGLKLDLLSAADHRLLSNAKLAKKLLNK